ncbi:MAG: hypothetical protein UF438_07535 [Oribacterium sp.]|nr:hypothetical protein [Oribacterium sp.]
MNDAESLLHSGDGFLHGIHRLREGFLHGLCEGLMFRRCLCGLALYVLGLDLSFLREGLGRCCGGLTLRWELRLSIGLGSIRRRGYFRRCLGRSIGIRCREICCRCLLCRHNARAGRLGRVVDALLIQCVHHALDDRLCLRELDALLEGRVVQLQVEDSGVIGMVDED